MDLDPSCGMLGILFAANEVQLRRSYVGVPGKLSYFVHLRPISYGVGNRRLAERVDADPASAQPVWINARNAAIVLYQSPRRLPIQVSARKADAIGRERPKQRTLYILPNSRRLDVRDDRPRCIEENLSRPFVALLSDVEVILNAIKLEMTDACRNNC
jgi:hypothetical protein